MKKLVVVLLLIAIGCSACSPPSAQASFTSSTVSAVPPLSEQEETSVASDTPAAPYRHGLTREQWRELQEQKELYEKFVADRDEKSANALLSRTRCINFEHLSWEHAIAVVLTEYVGDDEFNEWKTEREHSGQCMEIYSFAQHFSIELDELVSLIKQHNLALYEIDTVKRRYEYFFGGSQEETSIASAPYRQGFTQEQWQTLQDQKELYGDLTTFEKGQAQFNGNIDCDKFIHLYWEHLIDGYLIDYVSVEEFEAWARGFEKDASPSQCMSIYSFAKHFSIKLDELVSLIEENNLTHIYDLDTVKRRYEYFTGDIQEEVVIPPTAPPYCQGLTKKQWQRLQDQKEMYENLATDKEREEAVYSGKIECLNFEHLYWEHWIGSPFGTYFSEYVGADKFNAWKTERERAGQCVDIYSYAKHFSIELNELLSRMKENRMNYDFETLERRYEYINGAG